MRIWSLHPSHLDSKGLVALWREGLLAYHVLSGKTKGYTRHPQLKRFRNHENPIQAMVNYLHAVADEAERRGYHFDRQKLPPSSEVSPIPVTRKQLLFETIHLKNKLSSRAQKPDNLLEEIQVCTAHPSFIIIEGDIEE